MSQILNVDKRGLWRLVNRKFKGLIHHYHVLAIITILFDEIVKDLKEGKVLRILNLGNITLKKMGPRYYHNVRQRKMVYSEGYKILRFSLSSKIRKKIFENLDVDKTLKGD